MVAWYDSEVKRGPSFYSYIPATPDDILLLEDLGLAVLLEGRPQSSAALSLALLNDDQRDLSSLSRTPLHLTTAEERERIVEVVMRLVVLPGFASSLATKVLHKKRSATVPILDNQAIFGTLLSDRWEPGILPRGGSIRRKSSIARALDTIHEVVSSEANQQTFILLEKRYPGLTRIQLFDKTWWAFVRRAGK